MVVLDCTISYIYIYIRNFIYIYILYIHMKLYNLTHLLIIERSGDVSPEKSVLLHVSGNVYINFN
jgi:hypothetical protein